MSRLREEQTAMMSRLREEQTVLMRLRRWLSVIVLVAAAACSTAPPDRRSDVDHLTEQLRAMPGVVGATNTFGDDGPRGPAFFEVDVDVADGITGEQLAAISARYLDGLKAADYTRYRAELDVEVSGNAFVVDSSGRPVSNAEQIQAQARSWVGLRRQFPGSTVTLRAAISHADDPAGRGLPTVGRIDLANQTDSTAVAAAVTTLASTFADLTAGDWTITSGKQHPAEIHTSRRLPNPAEMELWNTLNADQAIPHADVFTINGPLTGPFAVSEKIAADDPDMALRLAEQHLPLVARLPAPIVYTASNEYRGHIGYFGEATSPVMVTIGGCTKRKYRPSPAEQALINEYERCPVPAPR